MSNYSSPKHNRLQLARDMSDEGLRRMTSTRDRVDDVLERWNESWPEADFSGRQVIWRMQLLAAMIDRILDQDTFMSSEIPRSGGRVLFTLRGSGPPHRDSAGQLAKACGITPGSMTAAIDRLEALELVERSPDPTDRRGVLVSLTAKGVEIAERLRVSYAEVEAEILSPLNAAERKELTMLLRRFLNGLEEQRPDAIQHI